MTISRKEIIIFASILALFIALHLPGLHYPYHQDEYKWVQYSHPEIVPPGTVPHPPLTELIYTRIGPLVGDDNFRLIPFAFGLINLFLLFYLVKTIFDRKTALWSIFIFTASFFSLLSSLMIDVDGAVMPMFFLILSIGYFKLKNASFKFDRENAKWILLILLGAIGGFLVKVSAILPILAVALDFAIERGLFKDKKKILKLIGSGILGILILVSVLFLSKFIFPFFNLSYSLNYWEHFANSSSIMDRGWLQTFIQFAKAIMYASPMLLTPAFLSDKEIWLKTRPFFFFLFIGTFFYLLIFDFSIGALDRYFEFIVIPLCIISAAVFSKNINFRDRSWAGPIFLLVSVVLILIQFVSHSVPPLYPKTEWLQKLVSLKWNFLFPFTGGSGPLPFYVSFAFISLAWIISGIALASYFKNRRYKAEIILGLLILGLAYNSVFIEEYLFGKVNGSSSKLVEQSINIIGNNKNIKEVLVYNDNGGWEVKQMGKYKRRIYASPDFESTYKPIFENYKGSILFINIPRVAEDSFYQKYFDSCTPIYQQTDKYIKASILDCR